MSPDRAAEPPRTATAELDALERAAGRATSPVGEGVAVWRTWGPRAGAPVLLLHGGSGSWNHWVRTIGPLAAAGRRVIVPDIPGFGESAAPPDGHDADAMPRWLEPGLATLVGDAPVDAVGFSFGGLVAGLWAAERPRRFRRLVIAGTPALDDHPAPRRRMRAWQGLPEGPERDAVHRHNLLQLMLAHPASADALAVAIQSANLPRDRLRSRRLFTTDILGRTIAALDCELAGIYGRLDVLFEGRHAAVERAFAAAPRLRSFEWVEDAGHWAPYERAAAFDAALARVLGD